MVVKKKLMLVGVRKIYNKMVNFLTEEQFNERKSQQDTIIPWRDVPEEKIFYIEQVEKIQTSKGEATIVTLCDRSGDKMRAFATSILAKDLEGSGYFIRSLGKKNSTKNKGQSYYHYELIKEPSDDDSGYDTVY